MPGSTTTTTFVWRSSPAYYEFTVPTSVFTITVDAYGGGGGSDNFGGFGPSRGLCGYIQGTIPVTPGEVLRVYVGTAGSNQGAGSAPVGGQNGGFGSRGDGGGASDVRRAPYAAADRLIVAGGGGGGGSNATGTPGVGGSGGYPAGTAGTSPINDAQGGQPGTASAGGAGGVGFDATGAAGALNVGGDGGTGITSGGGGGGSGYYGGGGGGRGFSQGGGGGGGSSAIPGGTLITHTTGARYGDGTVTFTYAPQESLPARTSDIRYLQGNDRYQVVVLANEGTESVAPEFRYWYAGPPDWESNLV